MKRPLSLHCICIISKSYIYETNKFQTIHKGIAETRHIVGFGMWHVARLV